MSQLGATYDRPGTAEDFLEYLRGLVAERRLQLNGAFHDFDRLRRGMCTLNQVKTVMTVLRVTLSVKDLEMLDSMFGDGNGGFFYRQFITALAGPDMTSPTPVGYLASACNSPSPQRPQYPVHMEVQLQDLELQIAKHVRLRQLPLKVAFQDFDRTRSGRVTRNQFQRVLDMMNVTLAEEQIQLLLQTYCTPDQEGSSLPRFAYLDFCKSIMGLDLFPGGDSATPYSVRTGHPTKYFSRNGQLMPLRGSLLPRPNTR